MTTENAPPVVAHAAAPWDRPWLFLLLGLALVGVAWVCAEQRGRDPLFWTLLAVGLSAGAWSLTVRTPTSLLVLAAAFLPLLAAQAIDSAWDSMRLLFYVGFSVALLGAGILALSAQAQRLVVSLLVVVHLGGIVTINMTRPAPDGEMCWLAQQIEARFYRPYLEFMYFTSSYHFYSPEAPPETLLWAQITFGNGERKWVTLPDEQSRGHLRDVRMLQMASMIPLDRSAELTEELYAARVEAGKQFDPPLPDPESDTHQYLPPTWEGKERIACIVRELARRNQSSSSGQPIAGIKLYIVVHSLLTRQDFLAGFDAGDPTTYYAYYLGDYTAEGKMKPSCCKMIHAQGSELEVHVDPLLYWQLPALYFDDGSMIDYVQLHACKN